MQTFAYARPTTVAEAVALLEEHGPDARVLAGGTDLIIRLRDGSARPAVVVDVKRIAELDPGIRRRRRLPPDRRDDGDDRHRRRRAGATATSRPWSRRRPSSARSRSATGRRSPATCATRRPPPTRRRRCSSTAPSVVAVGPDGDAAHPARPSSSSGPARRPSPAASWSPRIELPLPARRTGSAHVRRTRRRGHDLASVTLAVAVDDTGLTRLAYGSVGPRPVLVVDESRRAGRPDAPATRRRRPSSSGCSPRPARRRARCGRAPSTGWRCSASSAAGRCATAIERLAEGE